MIDKPTIFRDNLVVDSSAPRKASMDFQSPGRLNKDILSQFSYGFDQFQIESCLSLEEGHHVLCLAHTSAGKSTIAYYAIAKALMENKRLIYTSPVKSLSNQKYAELKDKYGEQSVGLATGDNKINIEADIVVMTTEILRNLLSKPIWTSPSESTLLSSDPVMDEVPTGSDIHSPADSFVAENARLSYVVFDEAHYINDRSRGNVYEECIMKLPNQVQMIFLSATMSNPGHFKKWVEQIKPDRPVGVSQTTHRPVPLRFHMFVPQPQSFEECLPWSEAIAEGHLRVILDGEHGEILCDVYADMVKRYRQIVTFKTVKVKPGKDDPCDDLGDEIGAGQVVVTKQVRRLVPLHMLGMLNKLINFLAINEQLPAIFFTLSRKKCNVLANQVESNLITHIERRAVEDTFNHYIRALEDYNQYRQVNELRVLLFKGVGVHHSGMLTILKEIVEVLFTKGLIKVMFATETLAIGVNTPTRVTCFTDVLKYDGYSSCKRVLTVEEFKQMAGRAGRRGLDTVGNVIYFPVSEPLLLAEMQSMLQGSLRGLSSNFGVTTQYVLRLLKSTEQCSLDSLRVATKKSLKSSEMQWERQDSYSRVDQLFVELCVLQDDIAKIASKSKSLAEIAELQASIAAQKGSQNALKKSKQRLQNMQDNLSKQEQSEQKRYNDLLRQAENLQKKIDSSHQQAQSPSDAAIANQLKDTVEFLRNAGFVKLASSSSLSSSCSSSDILELTQLGLFASCITQCHEIVLTQAIFAGVGDIVMHDPILLTGWLSLFVANEQDEQQGNHKDCPTSSSLPDNIPKPLHDACSSAIDLAESLFNDMHKCFKVFSEVRDKNNEGPPPPSQLISVFVSPALSWIRRDEHFEHICLNHGFFEGNFVRALQRMVNLFNELLVAFEITNQPEWVNCVQRAREEFTYGILLVDSIYV